VTNQDRGRSFLWQNPLVWKIANPDIGTDFPGFVDVGFEMEGEKA
jgi:hypothetical protein